MKKTTLRAACQWALDNGFRFIANDQGLDATLLALRDELEQEPAEDPADYVVFGSFIVRVSDAWKVNAEVYALSY